MVMSCSKPLERVTPPGWPLRDPEERECKLVSHGMTAGLAHQCHASSATLVSDAVGTIVVARRTEGGGGGGGGGGKDPN